MEFSGSIVDYAGLVPEDPVCDWVLKHKKYVGHVEFPTSDVDKQLSYVREHLDSYDGRLFPDEALRDRWIRGMLGENLRDVTVQAPSVEELRSAVLEQRASRH